jgi:hypothetical protein
MTTPYERFNSIISMHEFLQVASTHEHISIDMRVRAADTLMHYPSEEEFLKLIGERTSVLPSNVADALIEARASLLELMRNKDLPKELTRQALGIARHFPLESCIQDMRTTYELTPAALRTGVHEWLQPFRVVGYLPGIAPQATSMHCLRAGVA